MTRTPALEFPDYRFRNRALLSRIASFLAVHVRAPAPPMLSHLLCSSVRIVPARIVFVAVHVFTSIPTWVSLLSPNYPSPRPPLPFSVPFILIACILSHPGVSIRRGLLRSSTPLALSRSDITAPDCSFTT
ncbi:hypothetical protein BV20DRAFT_211286 [Pilatotrama ljubarskyi]|nr:hypothetical protein BV20DRAFT_211286 [Pilatotrama ljubarskyi]